MNTGSLLRGTAVALALVVATGATAQEKTSPPVQNDAPASGPVAQVDDGGIADIVVTAQKRRDTIQTVPVAVTALDQRALDSAAVQDIRDFAGRVPSLVVDSVAAGPGAAAIAIRGISFEDIEKSFDPAVGVVVDGVFIGTNTGQLLDSFDLERLEVLRGPQGTLFGRNTIAGVISVTRTKPTDEAGARGTFSYANFDTKRGRLVVNSGLLGGAVALKGFVNYDDTGGYYHNVTKNRREGKYETLSGGLTALIKPIEGITAEVTYEHERERGETVVAPLSATGQDVICLAVPVGGGAVIRPFAPAQECDRFGLPDHGLYTTFENIATPVRNDTNAITANINADLGHGFSLASITGYRQNKESVRQDFDASSINFFDTLRNQQYEQFSQELRVVGNLTDRLNLLVGAYYFASNYQNLQLSNFGAGLLAPVALQLRQDVDHHSKSYAGFADARYKLTDQLSFGGGVRYTEDKKRIFNNYGAPAALVPNGQCLLANQALCYGKASFGKFTWRANVDYQIEPSKLLYASFNKGFRSGGFNGRAASPTSLGPYQPETVNAYEAGLKLDWLDHKLRTNIAVYHTEYNNKQEEIVQPSPAGSANPQETVVKNAASARINGVELEVTAKPSRELTLTASFSYTDAKYKKFLNDVNGDLIPDDVSTLSLRRAPKKQGSIGVDYSKPIGIGTFDLSTTLRYQDRYATCIVPAKPAVIGAVTNDPRCFTSNRENLSAQIGYTFPVHGTELKLSIFGRNLTDKRDLASTLPVAGLLTFGTGISPRTYGIEAGFKF